MSIFRDTFKTEISGSLAARQDAMTNRTPSTIKYLSSRNSWIRMTSSVNINALNETARKNVLQGGALNNQVVNSKDIYTLRKGVGNTGTEAYSTKTTSGVDYKLGLRPMPGITSIEVKSKSAYGSLREVVVNFQCWDIHQLEELELLYMRPGYTALVEWGWYPYLKTNGTIETTPPDSYDIINIPATELSTIAKELYTRSLKSGGNYDATFGYIKNYQWSARVDGGYDCQTTIISTGEVIESLKVNYVRPDLIDYKLYDATSKGNGYLNPEFSDQGNFPSPNFIQAYEKNTLAGIWSELFYKLVDLSTNFKIGGIFDTIGKSRGIDGNDLLCSFKDLNFNNVTVNTEGGIAKNVGNHNIYITLDVALEFINKYISPQSNGQSLVRIILRSSDISSDSKELLCLAHPLQVSVDPSVCLIKSPLWYEKSNSQNIITNTQVNKTVAQTLAEAKLIVAELEAAATVLSGTDEVKFINALKRIDSLSLYNAVEAEISSTKPSGASSLAELIEQEFEKFSVQDLSYLNQIKTILEAPAPTGPGLTFTYLPTSSPVSITANAQSNIGAIVKVAAGLKNALGAIDVLKDIPLNYFYNNDPDSELGIIRNIYVNLDFLYRTATDLNLESQDSKEKNEISLYKYVKSVMTAINSSLGSMNNFEIHVDPIDNNVARVVDVNYTEPKKLSNLFELQVQNLNSVVRNYSLQSQIFPEQSSIIAIGSQAKGGQLGIQNNTMIDFNKGLIDRVIPEKEFPIQNTLHTSSKNNIGASLANIIQLFSSFKSPLTSPPTTNLDSLYSQSKNSLRDIIVYFQSTVNSSSANRSIIPIKFSFEMDGIGGLVIGHLFKVNKDILPNGYYKANLAQTITGISHTIGNGDWTTKIDALNIILDDPSTKAKFSTSVDIKAVIDAALAALTSVPPANLNNNKNNNNNNNNSNAANLRTGNVKLNSQTPRDLNNIFQIVLHGTEGFGDEIETMNFFLDPKTPSAVHYVVGRGGGVVKAPGGDLTKNLQHADNLNATSVGIEITNIGWMKEYDKSKGEWIDAPNVRARARGEAYNVYTPTERANTNRPKGTGGVTLDLGYKWMGYQYYEDLTDAQVATLKNTIKEIISQCPNILNNGKLNYFYNETNILENVWQLPLGGKPPVAGKNYNSQRNVVSSMKGIYVHATTKTGSHGDIHPSPKLIKMLQELKTELGA